MLNTPFSPWPSFDDDEVKAVSNVLLSNRVNYWTGDEGRAFEKDFAVSIGTKYSVVLANGTVALDAAITALGIGFGDEVIVTPRTFIASISSIINAGVTPVFADIDRDSQNIKYESIVSKISRKTKAIMCVHHAGWPCEMDSIITLAESNNLFVIEDCAQAHGARYKGQSVGSIGNIGAWSFCQDKIITTGGEGGMITTNDRTLWSKIWSLKDHGKSWEAVYENKHSNGYRWLHDSFGTNGRMTEMQAVIGRIQLKKLERWNQQRSKNAQAILNAAGVHSSVLRIPLVPNHIRHAWYKCYLFVRPGALKSGWSRDRITFEISSRGVPCYSGTCSEVYLEKAFDDTGFRPQERLPMAKELGETSIMFLIHPNLKEKEIELTCSVIEDVAKSAKR
jgi:dTDP-4-amino-4,6-dideoxygalactose transaminase